MTDDQELFADVVRSMSEADDLAGSMRFAVEGAVRVVPGAQHAGISMVRQRRAVETIAATDDMVRRGDELQYELAEGPCLQSIWQQETVQSHDLTSEDRWPTWSRRAADELGVRSMLCLQLFVTQETLGCLNLYSRRTHGFDDDDRSTALALAAHVAVALSSAQDMDDMESALLVRTVIGQAQGMLMQRYEMDSAVAFSVLQRVSNQQNRRVYDIAEEIVSRGVGSIGPA
jgi:GAF domain-containing protein